MTRRADPECRQAAPAHDIAHDISASTPIPPHDPTATARMTATAIPEDDERHEDDRPRTDQPKSRLLASQPAAVVTARGAWRVTFAADKIPNQRVVADYPP